MSFIMHQKISMVEPDVNDDYGSVVVATHGKGLVELEVRTADNTKTSAVQLSRAECVLVIKALVDGLAVINS